MVSSSGISWRRRVTQWGVVAGIWTVVVLAVAGDCCLHSVITSESGVSFWQSMSWAAPTWYAWALLTPLVLSLAYRFQPSRNRWFVPSLILLGCGMIIASVKVTAVWIGHVWLAGESLTAYLTPQRLSLLLTRRLPINLGVFFAIAVVGYLIAFFREQRARNLKAAQLEAQLAVAELNALKMQLQPHFVLNVLNTIAAMIHRSPNRAEEMVVRLGDLLRMVLDSREAHTVPLSAEVAFLKKYLEIEQIRFGDQLQLRLDVARGETDPQVPNLVLQPFVENAIKHRSLREGVPTVVDIKIWTEPDRVRLRIADNGPGLTQGNEPPQHGLGIVNTRARLDALYGTLYRLEFSSAQPSGLVVDVSLPLTTGRTHEEAATWSAA